MSLLCNGSRVCGVCLQGGASQPGLEGYSLPASQLPYAIPVEAWPRYGPLPGQVRAPAATDYHNGPAYATQQVLPTDWKLQGLKAVNMRKSL